MTFMTSPRRIDAAMDVPPDLRQPMTDDQARRLRELCRRAGTEFEPGLSLWQAERRIAALDDPAGSRPT
ncbi:DUF3072 domain-containing protein [Salipiger sp. H15]|uniref:DUF3072 domain-containing protein n=1 Tax=Alloyangia sp. H15 TaxID=3029062 RepID=A0AAU8ANU0_9RHOB